MRQGWTVRVSQTAAKYGDHAPAAAACCNACRTCVTTNLIGLLTGGVLAAVAAARRLRGRAEGA